MTWRRSCSWCHELNPVEARFCAHCGHQNGPRMECRCPRCLRGPYTVVTAADVRRMLLAFDLEARFGRVLDTTSSPEARRN